MATFFWLLVGHALCDYPLQGEFLAKAKNYSAPLPGVPWQWALWMHALIHGGAVALVMHSVWLGLGETVLHATIDLEKCRGGIDFNTDQWAHVVCKLGWMAIAAGFAG